MFQYVKQYLPLKIVQKMYLSLIEPYFRYCCPVWGCVGTATIQKLQKLQSQAARVATNSSFDAPSKPLIEELVWRTIDQLIKLETVKVVYKALHNEAPLYKKELFLKLSDTKSKELRNFSTDLYIPRLRTSMGQKSFRYRGVSFWNGLIDEAKRDTTYMAFKRILVKGIKQ